MKEVSELMGVRRGCMNKSVMARERIHEGIGISITAKNRFVELP